MLWRSETKKLLLTQRGLLILAVCLLLKALFLCAIPEQKDSRILLSQKQYDKYLIQLKGENTPEKSRWILAEYESCKSVKDRQQAMQERYAAGALTEAEWLAYNRELTQAELHINAAQIFSEKAEAFQAQDPTLPSAHFIYEYGWQTIYVLLRFPDLFLLSALLLLASQSFASEAAAGLLPVLLAARDGRRRLFFTKLAALLAVGLAGAALFTGVEAGIFALRGWFGDSNAPIYSVSAMTGCALSLTLGQGYFLTLWVRTLSALLLAGMIYALSLWIRSPAHLVFLGLCLAALPLLFGGTTALFTHGILLCGTRTLQILADSGLPLLLPLSVTTIAAIALLLLAAGRHRRGL